MAIDEIKLADFQNKLNAKIAATREKVAEMNQVAVNLNEIAKVEIPSDDEKKKFIIPVNPRTNKAFTTTERQIQFDNNVLRAKKMLAA